jgi:hypothetical protein
MQLAKRFLGCKKACYLRGTKVAESAQGAEKQVLMHLESSMEVSINPRLFLS